MSWFFGISKTEQSSSNPFNHRKHQTATLHELELPKLHIEFGGIDDTCFFEIDEKNKITGWAVVGIGIQIIDSIAKILKKDDWKRILTSDRTQLQTLNGHFVALYWNDDIIEFFTDQLGLRTAYYGKCEKGICFSTRLDWVAQATKLNEINNTFLGTRWLLFNQLSYESGVNGIERLGPASHVLISDGCVRKHKSYPWLPDFGSGSVVEAKTILESIIFAASRKKISLALSGGFDSRTVLAMLKDIPNAEFSIHTFGESTDPDVHVSKSIADSLGLSLRYFSDPIPNAKALIPLVEDFVAQNILVEPASSILRLCHYSEIHSKGKIIIDGGFGEIARRQYLNRLVTLGRSALLEKDISKIFPLLRTARADIFNSEYTNEIESAAKQSLKETIDLMPSIIEIGVENFVDLLSVRARVPNFGGPEQARSDAYVINFMPLVQPSFLKAVFKTNMGFRKNGRLYKEMIKIKNPQLQMFPLVKAGTTYPFGLPLPIAWLLIKVKNRLSKPYTDSTPDQFLMRLQEYVSDLSHSIDVKNFSYYDHKRIVHSVEAFYRGEKHFRSYINWWLTFEIWRKSLKG